MPPPRMLKSIRQDTVTAENVEVTTLLMEDESLGLFIRVVPVRGSYLVSSEAERAAIDAVRIVLTAEREMAKQTKGRRH